MCDVVVGGGEVEGRQPVRMARTIDAVLFCFVSV